MPPQTKAAWIRRVFVILLFGGAAAGGVFFAMPDGWKKEAKETSTAVQVTKENIDRIQGKPGVLTITNMRLDGNPRVTILL